MSGSDRFDVVVIGGGLNGLTVGAYLARAGARTAIIERRHRTGTHCSTEELSVPGVRQNLHASALVPSFGPCIEDLELERYGLQLVGGEWNFLHPFLDGKALLLPSYDANVAYKNIKRLSARDAASYKRFVNAVNAHIMDVAWNIYRPPSAEEEERFGKVMQSIPELPDVTKMDGFQLVDELFEDDHVKTVFASMALAIYGKARERYAGTFGVLASLTASSGVESSMTARGGSANLPRSIETCFLANGGVILENCDAERIIVRDGRARAVQLTRDSSHPGKVIEAKRAIVSNLTAVPTFLDLLGGEHLDRRAVRTLRSFDYGGQTLFTMEYVLDDIIRWDCQRWDANSLDAYWFHYGAESLDALRKHEIETEEGILSDPVVSVGGSFLYTTRDPSQAPPGMHTVTSWMNCPYRLRDGGAAAWDDAKEDFGEKVTERIEEYAGGFKRSIRYSMPYSPLDIYRRNPSAVDGNFQGGNLREGQLYLDRPFPGCGAPRTPIEGLYISNSIWPTSGTHLPTGYIAACVLAEDLGVRRQRWWSHEPLGWFRKWVKRASGREWSPFVTVD